MAASSEHDGRRYTLGPVERWIVAAGAAMCIWLLQATYTKLNNLVIQQAVTNSRLDTLSTQLSNIPQLTKAVSDLQAKQDDHERRITRIEEAKK